MFIDVIAFFALLIIVWYVGIRSMLACADRRDRREAREYRRGEQPPACVRSCANVVPGCFNRRPDEECRDYEPGRTRTKYDPRTGEVTTCRD